MFRSYTTLHAELMKNICYEGEPGRGNQSTLTVCIIFYLEQCFILFSDRCSEWRVTLGAPQHETELFVFLVLCVVN